MKILFMLILLGWFLVEPFTAMGLAMLILAYELTKEIK